MAYRVSEQAAADLDDIWYYIAKEGGLEIASRLIDSVRTLSSFLLGSPISDVHATMISGRDRGVFPLGK
jgi:plasmid stabilization system protein ParE